MPETDPTIDISPIAPAMGARLFAGAMSSPARAVEQAGEQVGLYTLVDKLGDGGFGSVWRASQAQPVEREVALKIIKLGMDTVEVMTRFEQERVALSMMEHPNIAKVLDAGATPEGRPFFVMELVRGVPITTYCLEKQMGLEQRLRLFKDVCAGVQHAHQKGIIHRDLKPSNILVAEVDGVPVPKIIDFGIAKAMSGERLTEHTLRTRAEQMIGTPLYMSPEQADGSADIDTRSDVYALGVLLYEMLAGQPPFDAKTLMQAGYEEMRRIIREVVPASPSNHKSQIINHKSKDLDLITLRALEKDRARRYESATAFAEDIQRFLNHEPVTARAPGWFYLTQRWVRRHRALTVAGAAILLGASLAVWQAVRATRERQFADAERIHARQAESIAKTEAARAQAAAGFVTKLLDDIAAEVDKGRNPEALKLAIGKAGPALDDLRPDPHLHITMLERMASLESILGEWDSALKRMAERVQLMAAIHGPLHDDMLEAELTWLKRMDDHGARAEAAKLLIALRQRLEQAGQTGSKRWFDVQRELVRAYTKLDDARQAMPASELLMQEAARQQLKGSSLIRVELTRATALESASELSAAEALLTACRERAQSDPKSRSQLPLIENQLISVLLAGPHKTRATALLRERLQTLKTTAKPDDSAVLQTLITLAEKENEAGELGQSIAHAQEAATLARTLAQASGSDSHRADLAKALKLLALGLIDADRPLEGISPATEAYQLAQKAGNTGILMEITRLIGKAHREAKQYEEAYQWFEKCHQLRQARSGNYKSRLQALEDMWDMRMRQQRAAEALTLARQWWEGTLADPQGQADPEHIGYVAKFAVKSWDLLHTTDPAAPTPSELPVWQSAQAKGDQLAEEKRRVGR